MKTTALVATNFSFPQQKSFYKGKVRDVYNIADTFLVMVATDRISAFDVVLPKGIPYKGQVLNQIASYFLDATTDIVPNWKIESPDLVVTIGKLCKPFAVEMVIRGYLSGSAWRSYKKGQRSICGVPIPDNMLEHQRFPTPIITPSTKAEEGHDEDISKEDIITKGLMTVQDYALVEKYTQALFQRGSEMAAKQGLILVDTKYEFGKIGDTIYLIDEIHTPDSSRYFMADEYEERFANNETQKQLSKEFVREWLMANGFQGLHGQQIPEMTNDFIQSVTERYIELFEIVTGKKFVKSTEVDTHQRIENNILSFLNNQGFV